MKKLFLILVLIFIVGCSSEKVEIKNGTFKLFENGIHIGTIYRLNNFQVEKSNDSSELIAKLEYLSDSTYYLRGTETNQKDLDTVFYINTFKEIEKNKYEIEIEPVNSNIEYKFVGVLEKTHKEIDKKYLDTLTYLNKNFQND